MKAAQSQEYEDSEETECFDAEEYRLHQFPLEPTRQPFEVLDIVGLGIIVFVCVFMIVAIVLGSIDEVRFLWHLLR